MSNANTRERYGVFGRSIALVADIAAFSATRKSRPPAPAPGPAHRLELPPTCPPEDPPMPTIPTAETFTDPHGRVWVHVPDAPPMPEPPPRSAPPPMSTTRPQPPRAQPETARHPPPAEQAAAGPPPVAGLEELQLALGLLLRQLLGPVRQAPAQPPGQPQGPPLTPSPTPPTMDERLRIPPIPPPPHLRRAETPAAPPAEPAPHPARPTPTAEPLRAALEPLTLAHQATQATLATLIEAQRKTQELVASLVTTAIQREQDAQRHHELLASLVTAAAQREQDARRHHELLASLVTAAIQREQDARELGEKLAEMSETIAAQETHQTKVQREHLELLRRHSDRGQETIKTSLDALHHELQSLRDDAPPPASIAIPPDKPRSMAPRPRALPASSPPTPSRADDTLGDIPPAHLSLG